MIQLNVIVTVNDNRDEAQVMYVTMMEGPLTSGGILFLWLTIGNAC